MGSWIPSGFGALLCIPRQAGSTESFLLQPHGARHSRILYQDAGL